MFKTTMALLFLLITCLPVQAEQFKCKVIAVHDGDTFKCSNGVKIRVWGIDTPEVPPASIPAQVGGLEARDYLRSKILNKKLFCTKHGKSYKRIVAQCFLKSDNKKSDIALPLLKKGYAKEETKYSKGYYSYVK